MIYEGLKQHDEALAWLERGYREPEPRMVFVGSEPKWNELRSALKLVRKGGFETAPHAKLLEF